MTMPQPNKRDRLLTSPAKLPLLTALEKENDVSEKTNLAAPASLLVESKRAKCVLSEVMNSVCYIYGVDFRDLEKLRMADAGEELVE